MNGPSGAVSTGDSRYASPPPEVRCPLGDVTNRDLKTPPRKISSDHSMEVIESPERKIVPQKENSSNENTPERKTPKRKISDVTDGKTPPRGVSLDTLGHLTMPGATEGKSVFGNDDVFIDPTGRSLLPPEGLLDISDALSNLHERGFFDELPQAVNVSAAAPAPFRRPPGIPMLSFSALGISKENEVSQEPFISPEKLLELRAELIPEDIELIDLLSTKGINVGSPIGKGANGVAYKTTVSDEAAEAISSAPEMIYKKEKASRLLTDINSKPKFWRHHDASAARLDLPHLAKPVIFLIRVEMDGRKTERFYVPADKMKEFGSLLPPAASVKMDSQLSEKAPGKNLAELMKKDENFFHPDGPHFANVVRAIDEFLRAAHAHNFIHRDLKPANIMYDPVSRKVTIIDTGEASRLRRRGKTDEEVTTPRHIAEGRLSNPTGSSSYLGTRYFMAPSISEAKKYGSEVDFFSAGMVILNLISPSDFKQIKSKRVSPFNDIFVNEKLFSYLQIYLDNIDQDSKTSKILEAHPHLRNLIDSYLKVSAISSPESEPLWQGLMTESKNVIDAHFSSGSMSSVIADSTSSELLTGSLSSNNSLAIGSSSGDSSPVGLSSEIDDLK